MFDLLATSKFEAGNLFRIIIIYEFCVLASCIEGIKFKNIAS